MGAPGRDPEFLKLCIDYVIVIFIRGRIMSFFPKFLRPYAAAFFILACSSNR
jgi:hypothetical protein